MARGTRPAASGGRPAYAKPVREPEGRDCGRPVTYRVEVRDGEPTHFHIEGSYGVPLQSKCHEMLLGRAQPCPGCPAVALARSSASKREYSVIPSSHGLFRVFSAEPDGDGQYLMHSMPLTDSIVSKLQRLRVDRLAREAGLSKREVAVLELLLLGRSSGVIASALGITERTVRFHVSNVLTKLEADSRADLLRLLL